ncbi:trehalose-phosphatase, partial [Piscinibacter sp.]|uniref:trehalose-phosphatase n=1 Tax=Piscinibacter sp. TaxID=1903157 RepID=UPI002D070781
RKLKMKHLVSPEGEDAMKAVMQRRPLLAFDFDGTLAPIVEHPDDARVALGVAGGLTRLAELGPVAIITGRAVDDVTPRLGFKPHYIVGNHGAEDPAHELPMQADEALNEVRERAVTHAEALRLAGVEIEDKQYSLALHYRAAPDAGAALLCIENLLQGIEPALKRFGGKCVVNVVAEGLPDKGDALASLVQRSGAGSAVFVGDDVNDEAVFIRADPHWLTVRVGRDDPLSRAMFFLDSQSELAVMLQKMLALQDD